MVTKQSGVSEVLSNLIKVDFWDTEKMASAIVDVLDYDSLRTELYNKRKSRVRSHTWSQQLLKLKITTTSFLRLLPGVQHEPINCSLFACASAIQG